MEAQNSTNQHIVDDAWDGAGALPFGVNDGLVYFLFQETHTGKKVGKLTDFGGARTPDDLDESICGAREFTEETAGLFTVEQPETAIEQLKMLSFDQIEKHAIVTGQISECHKLVQKAIKLGYYVTTSKSNDRWYICYLIEIPKVDLHIQNTFFSGSNIKKRRTYSWVPAEAVIDLFRNKTDTIHSARPLIERVQNLLHLDTVIEKIVESVRIKQT